MAELLASNSQLIEEEDVVSSSGIVEYERGNAPDFDMEVVVGDSLAELDDSSLQISSDEQMTPAQVVPIEQIPQAASSGQMTQNVSHDPPARRALHEPVTPAPVRQPMFLQMVPSEQIFYSEVPPGSCYRAVIPAKVGLYYGEVVPSPSVSHGQMGPGIYPSFRQIPTAKMPSDHRQVLQAKSPSYGQVAMPKQTFYGHVTQEESSPHEQKATYKKVPWEHPLSNEQVAMEHPLSNEQVAQAQTLHRKQVAQPQAVPSKQVAQAQVLPSKQVAQAQALPNTQVAEAQELPNEQVAPAQQLALLQSVANVPGPSKPIDGLYVCSICYATFVQSMSFVDHLTSVHGTSRCTLCGFKSESTDNLQRHIVVKHPPEQLLCDPEVGGIPADFRCLKCNIGFAKALGIAMHVALVHIRPGFLGEGDQDDQGGD